MPRLTIDGYELEKEWFDDEVQFIVTNADGYVCRLVAGEAGFELSALDRSLDNIPPPDLIAKLSDFIVRSEA